MAKETRNERKVPDFKSRQTFLTAIRNTKMARWAAHAYVRGNTAQFCEWLEASDRKTLPEGPGIWICGDCHTGNLGPVADAQGRVEIRIRDLDQTVIGNPAHDLIRLGVSLASAARGSDLPGLTKRWTSRDLSRRSLERRTVGRWAHVGGGMAQRATAEPLENYQCAVLALEQRCRACR